MEKIKDLIQIIKQPIDIMYKLTAINKCKQLLNIGRDESFGEYYYKIAENKKNKGAVYTPQEIADYIVINSVSTEDIINNPFLRILDPACGTGNLLIPCFVHLKNLYEENLDTINKLHNVNLKKDDINNHIIENNLFGFDIDEMALNILMIDIFSISHYAQPGNFRCVDFLLLEEREKFNIIIGNPPYIGQKTIDREYSYIIKKLYGELYKDKGDLSYCFFGAALKLLDERGKLSFITSRYFLESPSGEILRKTIRQNCSIDRIIDFYGIRPFKNIGVDPVIIFLSAPLKDGHIEVYKPEVNKEKNFINSFFKKNGVDFAAFKISKADLSDCGWILRDESERIILNKIEKKCFLSLEDICNSYQGIITGCDKAFIVDSNSIEKEKLEEDIIRPWIKSSFIKKDYVEQEDKFVIYSDFIVDELAYKNSMKHIGVHKEKLSERRECKSGIRKWFGLQWGRTPSIFQGEKIVFPYKSSSNRFALDKGSFFSADIYCLLLKNESSYTYNFLLRLLNSRVYEYYFKTFAKKLGDNLYEYYPNNLMKLRIPPFMNIEEETDAFLSKYFELTSSEMSIIKQYSKD